MSRTLATNSAPAAFGPYSQGMEAGGLVFASGQLGADPETGEISGDAAQQAGRALGNLAAVLAEAGCGLDRVVKTTIFLTDINDFAAVNAVYGERFGETRPARSTVQVAALPRGARVEIEAIAVK